MTQDKPESLPAPQTQEATGYAMSQRAAEQCRQIVESTATEIEGKRYVAVSGWQAIAIAHQCVASAGDVETEYDPQGNIKGYKAVGEVRRMSDGVAIARGEGFVGVDEAVWFGGKRGQKTYYPRPAYAIRAMAQTRAISRACRSAFAHVVVMINRNLSTTPAEEMETLSVESQPGAATPTMKSMKEEASEISQSQGHPPGARSQGARRRAGEPLRPAEIQAKKKAQVEAAVEWLDEHLPAVRLMSQEEIGNWEKEEAIAPRLHAMKQGYEEQPGFEHLGPAYERYLNELELIRKPVL